MSEANGIQESGGRQTHSRESKPPVWGKENRSPEAPERMRQQRGPTESVALNMPCAHIRSRRSWLRAYALALICRPSASSAAPQALQGSISFSCVTGGAHLRLRLDEPPPATFCRPPDSQIRLAVLAGWRRQTAIYQLKTLTEHSWRMHFLIENCIPMCYSSTEIVTQAHLQRLNIPKKSYTK